MQRRVLSAIAIMATCFSTSNSLYGQIETLVMPGPVIEGHADLEGTCKNCHVAFTREKQRALCLDCHEDVATDIKTGAGFHGLEENAKQDSCASCHTEHKGRDADVVNLNIATFNHDLTDFPLLGGHTEVQCDDCHTDEFKLYRDAPSDCIDCHEDDNVHADTMGEACDDCHKPESWEGAEFDHETTGYSLIGNHAEAACLDCHEDQTFQPAATDCYSCHADDDAHDGKSGNECERCHSPTGWEDTKFDHSRDTDFPLLGKHSELTCDDCHSDDPFGDTMDTACVACHLEDDNHDTHFGDVCDTCHTTDGWDLVAFDHNINTDHPLNGVHATVECTECHIEPIFEVSPLGKCNDCHAEDDPHEGTQGIRCQDCHNEDAWDDKVFFDHDLTNFPLLGHHQDAKCDDCHESHRFSDASTECVDCHKEDDPHEGNFHSQCDACHNPVDWQLWIFDHDSQTEFPLTGAHTEVKCADCHRNTLERMRAVENNCSSCHRADDVHDGEFGFDCGRCHSADSFEDVRSLQ